MSPAMVPPKVRLERWSDLVQHWVLIGVFTTVQDARDAASVLRKFYTGIRYLRLVEH
jgi:hypothetical protein